MKSESHLKLKCEVQLFSQYHQSGVFVSLLTWQRLKHSVRLLDRGGHISDIFARRWLRDAIRRGRDRRSREGRGDSTGRSHGRVRERRRTMVKICIAPVVAGPRWDWPYRPEAAKWHFSSNGKVKSIQRCMFEIDIPSPVYDNIYL